MIDLRPVNKINGKLIRAMVTYLGDAKFKPNDFAKFADVTIMLL